MPSTEPADPPFEAALFWWGFCQSFYLQLLLLLIYSLRQSSENKKVQGKRRTTNRIMVRSWVSVQHTFYQLIEIPVNKNFFTKEVFFRTHFLKYRQHLCSTRFCFFDIYNIFIPQQYEILCLSAHCKATFSNYISRITYSDRCVYPEVKIAFH